MKSRTQGSRPRPRPRTQKKSEAKAKDSLSEDRHSRGQGQECSRPRPRTKDTAASVLQKKRSSKKFFRQSPIYRRNQDFWWGGLNHKSHAMTSKTEVESRTQGSRPRPRPRTQKKSEAKDSLSEDRHSRGQGQECSRPRPRTKDTSASVLQKKKKVFTKIFQAISTKKRFPKNFSTASQNFNNSKNTAVLEPRTGQFSRTWGLEAKAKDLTFEAKAKDFKICPRGRPRGQGRPRGLHLWSKICLLALNQDFAKGEGLN